MSTIIFRRIQRNTWRIIIPQTKNLIMKSQQNTIEIQENGWKSNPKLFKIAMIGVIVAGVSYLTIKKYR